jgi:hypothetical protein
LVLLLGVGALALLVTKQPPRTTQVYDPPVLAGQ